MKDIKSIKVRIFAKGMDHEISSDELHPILSDQVILSEIRLICKTNVYNDKVKIEKIKELIGMK